MWVYLKTFAPDHQDWGVREQKKMGTGGRNGHGTKTQAMVLSLSLFSGKWARQIEMVHELEGGQ